MIKNYDKLLANRILKNATMFAMLFLVSFSLNSQCEMTSPYGTATAPTSGSVNISTCNYLSEYSTINTVAANTGYSCDVVISGASTGYVTIREGAPNGAVVAHGDAPLDWVSNAAGTYYAHWTADALCATATGCHTTSITYVGVGCSNSSPYATATAPTSGSVNISTCNYLSEYSTLNGVVGGTTYALNITNAGTTMGYITVRSGSATGTLVALGNAPLTFTAPASGTYYCHWNVDSACATASGCHVTSCQFINSGGAQCTGIPNAGVATGDTSTCDAFTVATNGATLDLGVDYQWQSSPAGFIQVWSDIAGATDTSYTGSQTVDTYYRMRSICTNTNDTVYSTDWYILMNAPLACYCIPNTTQGCNDGDVVARVVLNTLDNNSGTGCPSGLLGYSDYTGDTSLTTTLLPSNTYNCTVYAGQYSEGYAVWIDYNDDGAFDNATERVGYSIGTVAGSGSVGVLGSSATFPVVLSCNPPAGQHRMRVRAMYATNGINVDPCVANSYGETEDYLITIASPPPCPSPGAMNSVAVSSSSVDLEWPLGCSNATTFELEYGPVGFTQGSGTTVSGVTPTIANDTASYTLTGLSSNTQYSVYYKAVCDSVNSVSSAWSINFDFTTVDVCLSITVDAGLDQTVCSGDSVILQATGNGGIVSWSGGPSGNTAATYVVNPAVSSIYVASTYDSINNCTDFDTVDITVIASSSSTLNETGLDSVVVNGQVYTQAGVYTQTQTNAAGCDSIITINVDITNACSIDLGPDVTVCYGDSIFINAGGQGFSTYSWSTGSTNSLIVDFANYPVGSSQNYAVVVTDSANCTAIDTVTYTIGGPTIVATGDVTICEGDTVTMSATGSVNNQYVWNPGGTTGPTIYDTPSVTTTYVVTGYDSLICEGTDTVVVTVSPVTYDSVQVSGNDSVVVNGQTYTQSGVYTQVLTSVAGCDSIVDVDVTVTTVAGLDNLSGYNLSVYPNPTRGTITLKGINNLPGLGSIILTDNKGVEVRRIENNFSVIDLSDFTTGVYYLQINFDDGVGRLKVIKQ